jgi:hypothetical protein
MGARDRIVKLLGGDGVIDADPEAQVEATEVPISEGPLLVAALQADGIEASGIESFNIVTESRNRMRIMVRRADLDAARQITDR